MRGVFARVWYGVYVCMHCVCGVFAHVCDVVCMCACIVYVVYVACAHVSACVCVVWHVYMSGVCMHTCVQTVTKGRCPVSSSPLHLPSLNTELMFPSHDHLAVTWALEPKLKPSC